MGAAGERPELDVKPPLEATLRIFRRGDLLKSFSQLYTYAKRWGFEIGTFPLLVEMPHAIKLHLPVCYSVKTSGLRLRPSH